MHVRDYLEDVYKYMEKEGLIIKNSYETLFFRGIRFEFRKSKKASIFFPISILQMHYTQWKLIQYLLKIKNLILIH